MWTKVTTFLLGARVPSHLPARVQAAITHQQWEAEILIGWVQLVLVVTFGVLYAAAPRTIITTGFNPVPWALALYLVITLVRLFSSYRFGLPRWALVASVVADIGLLMLLIWSFHIQYQQPPSFYLKAPTMLYVFIFIAMRALRFEATYVLIAGGVAALGWLALMLYVIYSDPADAMITRDYVVYLTSNSILIGAEVDKIISILLVTAVLSVALVRARRLLVRSVIDATAAKDLSRFVAPEVARRITSAERQMEPGDGEVKNATVLFCDIERFASISERMGPEDLVRTLNEYLATVSQVIDRYRGVITQYQGDAMLITFNAATPDDDHAANAVRTALGIQDVVATHRFGAGFVLKTRCGINTGEVTAGAVGTAQRLLFTVHGDHVNVAARLEQLNKEYGTYILLTETTKREAGEGFAFERIGEVTVRGRQSPTTLYTVHPTAGAPAKT